MGGAWGRSPFVDYLYLEQDLVARYIEYEEMDDYPEVGVALDIYADDATVPAADDETVIWGYSADKDVKEEIDHVLAKVNAHDDIWAQVRTLCKYGDVYAEIVLGDAPKEGVIGVNFLPPPTVRRIEHPKLGLLGFMQNPTGMFPSDLTSFWNFWSQHAERPGKTSAGMAKAYRAHAQNFSKFSTAVMFEDWEVIHWRMRGKHLRSIYGHPVIEPARWPWRRLALMEDAAIFYKLERTPSRHAFYIDIGSDDARRGRKKLQDARRDLSRKRYVDSSGNLDTRFNILAPDEDFFIPVRDGKRLTDVELLQGADFSETDTLDYFRKKLVSSLKVPQSYMGSSEGEARNMLSSEDIRFARTEMRVQQATRRGWHKLMRVHFAAQGRQVKPEDYDVRMAVPSQILDLARSEVMSAKADLASRLQEIVGTKWVITNVLGFSEDPDDGVDVISQVAEGEGVLYLFNKSFATADAEVALDERAGFRPSDRDLPAHMIYPVRAPLEGRLTYGQTLRMPLIGKDCAVIEVGLDPPSGMEGYDAYLAACRDVVRSFGAVFLTPL